MVPGESLQSLTSENTTLKQRVQELTREHRTLQERLEGARSNLRFAEKRIAALEAEPLEQAAVRFGPSALIRCGPKVAPRPSAPPQLLPVIETCRPFSKQRRACPTTPASMPSAGSPGWCLRADHGRLASMRCGPSSAAERAADDGLSGAVAQQVSWAFAQSAWS
ncbi:hypothetical protein [Streptomyces sp. NRRL S-495]|uniref:hypothetical protein n=1 Tax=Streptomyces sp. NRRL S-495 TaxID=1609133 RepID=UPI000A6B9160|nr:hypothetical protein [Streptomyces sp. NRRL S-495]